MNNASANNNTIIELREPYVEALDNIEIEGSYLQVNKEPDLSYKTHLSTLPGNNYEIDGEKYIVKLLQDENDWSIYRSIWNSVIKRSANHNLFHSYDFLQLWWRHFSNDKKLFILFICKEGEIIGIATFNILNRKIRGITFKEIGFIGSPLEVDRPGIVMVQDEKAGIKSVVRYLSENRKAWHLLQIFEQEEGEALEVMKQAFKESGVWIGHKESSQCYYLDCTEDWDGFIASKSRKFKRNIRTAKRKLEQEGNLEYKVYTEWPDIKVQLDNYREIERRSRKESEKVGIAKTPQTLAFYYSLAETFANKGDFCIRVLTIDEKPIVATFGIYFDQVFYSLQITHDLAYNKASPGTYIESLELEECYKDKQCKFYDFLGAFVNNKSRWSSTSRLTESLHIYKRTPILTLVYLYHFKIEPHIHTIYNWIEARLKKTTNS